MNSISIITVCFNSEKEIGKTIRSVLGQTYEEFEYIIVDGNSSDNTIEVAKEIIAEYSHKNVRVISEPDRGIYDAMNKAIKLAHGDWLNFMNSGDVFSNNHIVKDIVDSGLMDSYSFIYSDFIVSIKGKLFGVKESFGKGRVLHQSLFYKKVLHEKYGSYLVTHPYIVSDYLFFIQVDEKLVAKYKAPISINDGDGISMSGNWAPVQKECVDFMFRKCGAWGLVFRLIKTILKQFILKVIR